MQDRSRFNYVGNHPKSVSSAQTLQTQSSEKSDSRKMPVGNFWKRRWWLVLVVTGAVLLLIWLGYSYVTTRNELQKLSKSSVSSQQEILAEIGKHLELPSEEPVVATISDVTKLTGQEFFKNAQNGDKVFIFASANKALIYRPSNQKVIEYSKVNLDGMNQVQ